MGWWSDFKAKNARLWAVNDLLKWQDRCYMDLHDKYMDDGLDDDPNISWSQYCEDFTLPPLPPELSERLLATRHCPQREEMDKYALKSHLEDKEKQNENARKAMNRMLYGEDYGDWTDSLHM